MPAEKQALFTPLQSDHSAQNDSENCDDWQCHQKRTRQCTPTTSENTDNKSKSQCAHSALRSACDDQTSTKNGAEPQPRTSCNNSPPNRYVRHQYSRSSGNSREDICKSKPTCGFILKKPAFIRQCLWRVVQPTLRPQESITIRRVILHIRDVLACQLSDTSHTQDHCNSCE